MLTADQVAAYLLDRGAGGQITHMKLQKLLYYSQGFHAAMRGGLPLFADPIEAWPHGPVVELIYRSYKSFGKLPVAPPASLDPDDYLPEDRELLDAVIEVYGRFSAKKLRDLSHDEAPWDEAFRRGGQGTIIPLPAMSAYFAKLVEAGRRGVVFEGHPIWPATSFQHQRRPAIAARFAALRERMDRMIRNVDAECDPWGDE